MGISLVVKDADFSDLAVGFNGLYTSLSAALTAIYDLRSPKSRALSNPVTGRNDAYFIGSPTVSIKDINVVGANTIDFGVSPTGERTIAFVTKIQAGSTAGYDFLSSKSGVLHTTGGETIATAGSKVTVSADTYTSFSKPLPGRAECKVDLTIPPSAEYELVVVTLKNGVGATLYIPRLGISNFTAAAAGSVFATDNALTYRVARAAGAANYNVAMFALWEKPLTPSEVDLFYNEIKPQLQKSGVAI